MALQQRHRWHLDGAVIAGKSVASFTGLARSATDIEERRRLEIQAYEMAQAARTAIPNLERKKEMSPGASPVSLFLMPVTLRGVQRHTVLLKGWPVSPSDAL